MFDIHKLETEDFLKKPTIDYFLVQDGRVRAGNYSTVFQTYLNKSTRIASFKSELMALEYLKVLHTPLYSSFSVPDSNKNIERSKKWATKSENLTKIMKRQSAIMSLLYSFKPTHGIEFVENYSDSLNIWIDSVKESR